MEKSYPKIYKEIVHIYIYINTYIYIYICVCARACVCVLSIMNKYTPKNFFIKS